MILQNLFCTAAPFIVLSSSFTQRSLYETHTKGFSRVPGFFLVFLHGDPVVEQWGKKQYMKGSPCWKMGNKPGTLENSFVCVSYKERYAKLELSTMKGAAVQNNFCNIMYASCCMQHSNIARCILFMVRLQTKSFAQDLLVRHNTQKV